MASIFKWFTDVVSSTFTNVWQRVNTLLWITPEEDQYLIEQVVNRRLLGNAIAHYEIQNRTSTSPTDFLNNTRGLVTNFFRNNPNNKFQISFTFIVIKVDASGAVVSEEETGRSSKQESVYSATNIDEVYDRMKDRIIESFAAYMRNGSGWRLKKIVKLTITKSRLNPLRRSSHIPLPDKIKNTKALINLKNNDNECFKYAVTRALNPLTRDAERISKELKGQTKKYNWDGIEFPTPSTERQLKKLEKNNESLLVFGHVVENALIKLYLYTHPETVARKPFDSSFKGVRTDGTVTTVL